jgi:hypothetical protein
MKIEKIGEIMRAYRLLLPISKSLNNHFTNDCNYGNTTRRDNAEGKLVAEAKRIAASINLNIYVQGDPRGCSLYLVAKSEKMPEQNYTNGIAIY